MVSASISDYIESHSLWCHLEAKKNIDSDCVGCIVVWTALALAILAYVFIIFYV